jgi:hypothetical protein
MLGSRSSPKIAWDDDCYVVVSDAFQKIFEDSARWAAEATCWQHDFDPSYKLHETYSALQVEGKWGHGANQDMPRRARSPADWERLMLQAHSLNTGAKVRFVTPHAAGRGRALGCTTTSKPKWYPFAGHVHEDSVLAGLKAEREQWEGREQAATASGTTRVLEKSLAKVEQGMVAFRNDDAEPETNCYRRCWPWGYPCFATEAGVTATPKPGGRRASCISKVVL